jgi:transcriptional regulator with XRE-family HTH domain
MTDMGKKKLPKNLHDWVEARKRHHLSQARVQMARELGMKGAARGWPESIPARERRNEQAPNVDEAGLRRIAHRLGTPWRADELVAHSMKRAHYDPVVTRSPARR